MAGNGEKERPDMKTAGGGKKNPGEDSSWRVLRIRRRIKAGYYNRPEVRARIVESLLDALMEGGR